MKKRVIRIKLAVMQFILKWYKKIKRMFKIHYPLGIDMPDGRNVCDFTN